MIQRGKTIRKQMNLLLYRNSIKNLKKLLLIAQLAGLLLVSVMMRTRINLITFSSFLVKKKKWNNNRFSHPNYAIINLNPNSKIPNSKIQQSQLQLLSAKIMRLLERIYTNRQLNLLEIKIRRLLNYNRIKSRSKNLLLKWEMNNHMYLLDCKTMLTSQVT